MNKKLVELIVTFLGVGKSPFCPGTFGSIATLPLWFLIISMISILKLRHPTLIMSSFIVILYVIGYGATELYLLEKQTKDPKEIVIDEVVGQLLAFFLSLSFSFFLGGKSLAAINSKCPYFINMAMLVTPIIFFRLYDILKPGIIGTVDRKMENALGVMLDDVLAGIFAGITNVAFVLILVKFLF